MDARECGVRLTVLAGLALMLAQAGAGATDVEITQVDVPDSVRAGDTILFDVTVANQGDTDVAGIDVSVSAFDQTKTRKDVDIRQGQSKTVTLNMTVPRDASGPYTAEVTADAGTEKDVASVDIDVEPFEITLSLSPSTATIGDHVTVSGRMSARNQEFKLYLGGRFVSTLRTDETGHYSTTVTPQKSGALRVRAVVGTVSAEKILQVEPKLAVTDMSISNIAVAGERTRVCSAVTWNGEGSVTLSVLAEGEQKQNRSIVFTGTREECFDIRIHNTGEQEVSVVARSGSVSARNSATTSVIEPQVDVQVRPTDLTLITGQAGVITVTITNDGAKSREFTVDASGLANISDAPQKTVSVARGAEESVYLRVVPGRTQTYTGDITVSSADTTYATQQVTVTGTENPALKKGTLLGAVEERFGGTTDTLVRNRYKVVGGIIGVLLLIIVFLYWRAQRAVLEPRR